MQAEARDWEEFTEAGFRRLLVQLTEAGYRFADYGDNGSDRHVLWRHDVDLSVHRAARLAAIEAELGAHATYFLNPRSEFYNLAEPAVLTAVRTISTHGHAIGLHFDAAAYDVAEWTRGALLDAVHGERNLVEMLLGMRVRALSWHNPDLANLLAFGDEWIAGLHNAYASRLQASYVYASDSNGYWRFRPMAAVIADGAPRLHLLTHPGWWTPETMSPSERVDRCIRGRAKAVRAGYDAVLLRGGRANRGKPA